MNDIEVSVVMPCLNEEKTLANCISKARQAFERLNIIGEVVVADNGSTDNSSIVALKEGAIVIPVKAKGYGNALRGGVEGARGKYIIMGDADCSYDFSCIDDFVCRLREGYDLVMGNRFKGGIMPGAMPPLHYYLGNPVLSGIGKIFFRTGISDFHCGLRGFSKEAYEKMAPVSGGMEFASELVIKASLLKLKVTEVPIILYPDGRDRPPHLRSWQDGWRHLKLLLLYAPRWLFLYPGMALLLIGLFLGGRLVMGSLELGNIRFDIHTLFYTGVFCSLGITLLLFYMLSITYGEQTGYYPPDTHTKNKMFRLFSIERGLILGGFLFLAGVLISLYAFVLWGKTSYRDIDPESMLRIVIPGGFAIICGVQIMLIGFMLNIAGNKE